MDVFQDLFNCQQCKQPFDGTPVVTNCCNATICPSHFPLQESQNPSQRTRKRKYFKCDLCGFDHESDSKKFANNTVVEKLLKMELSKSMCIIFVVTEISLFYLLGFNLVSTFENFFMT